MRITIEFERPRKVRRLVALVAALAAGMGAAGVVTASHLFADVSTSSAFHTPIAAIARAGLTVGCGGGNFCPDSTITRGQEAALLHRGLSRVAMYTYDGNPPYDPTGVIGSVTIVVPGSSGLGIGANQFVKVDAYATLWSNCRWWVFALDYNTESDTEYGVQSGTAMPEGFDFTLDPYPYEQVSTAYVFSASPGSHTYYLKFRAGDGDCYKHVGHVTMVATTHAFGATGHDVLGGS